jgi:hypothetical protein
MSEGKQSVGSSVLIDGVSSQEVSFQVYQDVYNRITGRSEKIRRFLFDKHVVTLEHFLNLNSIVEQSVEQYTCHNSSVTISVSYIDGSSERWSSFEKFKMQAPTKSVCAESVEIEYDLLLTLPNLKDPRPYKLILGLRSETAFQEKMDKDGVSDFARRMTEDMKMATARLSISYVDLVVARSFEACIVSWYNALPRVTESHFQKLVRFLVPASNYFTRVLIVFTAVYVCFVAFKGYVVDIEAVFSFGLLSAAIISSANMLSFKIGAGFFRGFSPFSLVRISDADRIVSDGLAGKSSKLIFKTLASWLGIVAIGVIANYVSKLII